MKRPKYPKRVPERISEEFPKDTLEKYLNKYLDMYSNITRQNSLILTEAIAQKIHGRASGAINVKYSIIFVCEIFGEISKKNFRRNSW